MQKKSKAKAVIAIILAGVIVFVIINFLPKKVTVAENNSEPTSVPVATKETTQNQVADKVVSVADNKSAYKDGSYSAVGNYNSPEGSESIKVTVTLKNGIITDSSVIGEASDHTSKRYQNMFISGFKQYVIGKSIDQVSLNKVSGSSLTPDGFNNAIAKIKNQAAV